MLLFPTQHSHLHEGCTKEKNAMRSTTIALMDIKSMLFIIYLPGVVQRNRNYVISHDEACAAHRWKKD
eukprot:1102927-Pelagomonas_calceolata.AAC.1